MCPYMLEMKANLFISMPHARRFSSSRFFFFRGDLYSFHRDVSWGNRLPIQLESFDMTLKEHTKVSEEGFLSVDTSNSNPSKSPQMEESRQWKTTLEVKLFMYDGNDVIRKKIISEILLTLHRRKLRRKKTVFAFSSWLYLILILWLFSDHIQMGIRRKRWDERWCKSE